MKKYNEEYFSVINRNTGRKICDCAEYSDAMMMFDIDPHNRQIKRNKFIMGPVVDIEMPKSLPTNEIVVNMDGGVGGSWRVKDSKKLPEGQSAPVIV